MVEGDRRAATLAFTSPGPPAARGGMRRSNSRIIPTVADSGGQDLCPDRRLRDVGPAVRRMTIREVRGAAEVALRRDRPPVTDRNGIRGLENWTWGCAHDREARHFGPSRRPRSAQKSRGFARIFKKSPDRPASVANMALTSILMGPLGYGVTAGAAHTRGRVSD